MSRNVLSRNSLLAALFFCAAFLYLFLEVRYHLIFKEQMIMFLFDSCYVDSILSKPAFAAQLAGDFFTQFFLFSTLAPALTLIALFFLWLGLRYLFLKHHIANPAIWALFPTAAEFALQTQFEYPLAMALGAAMSVWAALLCSNISNNRLRALVSLLLTIAAYPLVGAYALLFIFLVIASERHSLLNIAILCLAAAVSIWCEHLYYQMTLPDFISYPVIPGYNIRYTHIFLCVPALAIVPIIFGGRKLNPYIVFTFSLILAASGAIFFHDSQREYDLKLSSLAYHGKWNNVAELAASNDFESQTGAYYRNLTNARNGVLVQELLNGYQPLIYGLFMPVNGNESYIKIFASVDAMLQCRDYAQAQHAAIVGMNFSPRQTSTRMTRVLAEVAIINRDTLAAKRYCSMLKKTLFYKNWAVDAESVMYDDTGFERNMVADTVFKVNDFQNSLRSILSSDPSNRTALDYLLCFDLLQKNLVEFMNDYDRFYMPYYRNFIPPVIYQQALEMMEAGMEYNISQEVEDANQDFLSGNESKYRNSYWFYFKYAQAAE